MKNLPLFLKQTLRRPAALITALILALLCALSFGYTHVDRFLPCALCTEDASPEAQRYLSTLEPYGFELCGSRDEVISRIEEGTADCGLIVLDGLKGKVVSGQSEGCLQMVARKGLPCQVLMRRSPPAFCTAALSRS